MLLHKSNKIIKDDVTLLIQGKYSNVFINKIDNYIPHFKKIIYSTWNDNNIDFNNNVEYIINKLPNNDVYNLSNIYYQCKSILNGIQRIKTKYVLKHRSDEYYSNIELLYTYFNGNLLCSNVYFRPIKYKPYHISDHFFLGETERIRETFLMLEKYLLSNDKYSILNRKYSPEMSITLFYLLTFGEYDMNYFINNYNNKEIVFSLMKKYFDVVDVNELSPLHISNNQVNKSFTKGFNDNNSIKTINDLI